MSRGKKLLILLAVMVLAGAAALVIPKITAEPEETEEADTGKTLFTAEEDAFTALSWTVGEETLSFSLKDGKWQYSEDDSFPLDQEVIADILTGFREVAASKTIDKPEALDVYGLEEPSGIIRVTTAAGETAFSFGAAGALTSGTYLSLGDGAVYLVDSGLKAALNYELLDLVEKEILPTAESVTALTLKQGETSLRVENHEGESLAYDDSYVWFAADFGSFTTLDTDLAEALISKVTGFSFGDCVSYQADSEELSAWGLGEDALALELEYTDAEGASGSYALEMGQNEDGDTYVRIADSPLVYTMTTSVYTNLSSTSLDKLLPDDVVILNTEELSAVTLTLEEESYTFTHVTREVIAGEEEEESTEAESESTEESTEEETEAEPVYETVWLWDESENAVDLDTLLSELTAMSVTGYAGDTAADGKEELSFSFTRNEDYSGKFRTFTLKLLRVDADNCLALLNGEATVLVARADVSALRESLMQLVLSLE